MLSYSRTQILGRIVPVTLRPRYFKQELRTELMLERLQRQVCLYSPSLRSDIYYICDRDWRAALMLDYFIYFHIGEYEIMCSNDAHYAYKGEDIYSSSKPSLVYRLIGNVMTEPEISNACEKLIKMGYLKPHPVIKDKVALCVHKVYEAIGGVN